MKRRHRSIHRTIWPLLAILVGLGLTMSLILRAPPAPALVEAESRR